MDPLKTAEGTRGAPTCYVTMTDLEKMGDKDWADVCRFYYSVCSALWEPVTFHLFNEFS
jgi:hypothetical protein